MNVVDIVPILIPVPTMIPSLFILAISVPPLFLITMIGSLLLPPIDNIPFVILF